MRLGRPDSNALAYGLLLSVTIALGCTVGDPESSGFSGSGASANPTNPTNPTQTSNTTTDTTDGTDTDTGDVTTATTAGPTTDPVTTDPVTTDPVTTDPSSTTMGMTSLPTTETTDPGPICGNGVVEGNEVCDGADLGGQTCTDFGYTGGTLACTGMCMYDTSNCVGDPDPFCGDGNVDPGEACDGANLNGKTCQTQGFDMGNLACTGNCTLDTSGCSNQGGQCGNQPATGPYMFCAQDNNDCTNINGPFGCASVLVNNVFESGFCSEALCVSNNDCTANVAGCTATPVCQAGLFVDANMNPATGCMLDCTGGKTCPVGMECFNIQDFGFRCY